MKAAATQQRTTRGKLIALAFAVIAIAAGVYAWHRTVIHPSTDDATIDADIVHVAPAVGGRIIELAVAENEEVAQGDLLFQIDPLPYRLAVAQAEADLAIAEAELETRRRVLSTEQSNVSIAGDQARRAQANSALSARTVERLRPLASRGYVPKQALDQAEVTHRDSMTSLRQAQEQQAAALRAVGTEEGAEAAIRARQAALAIARRALEDTTVRAPHPGRVVGLKVLSGEMVIPSQSLFTLVNSTIWYAVGNFRETVLQQIAVGDCVTAYSMIDRQQPIEGIVEGIGWGVIDEERINLPRSVPYVQRSLNWVRVEQRFPVRIRLENPPQQLMRLGASAVVEVKHGAACK
ncbi:multidrug transporter subunit MdtN [Steroidobacter cummioxidans]|uniref:multidrug transporter subunit MdtN n=1 Tax=Steroidobacter cummioxidans TaxID=1803913 RepID=UPI000E3140BB|nr:multidrug transporter subunit MdtN [Steroidobacter cummioxidans]